MLCFGFNSYAQQPSIKLIGDPVSVTGHLIRTTPKLADIDKTTMYGQPLVITRDENGIIGKGKRLEETEERITEEMRERIAREYKEAIKNFKPETPQSPIPAPSVPGTSLGVNFNGQTSPGLQPTDNNMAAGPNHLIQIVNNVSGSQFTIYNKSGVVVGGPTILASLTGRTGSGDPIVLYDQLADRWFMAEFGPSACCSELIMAVSTTSNPTGSWSIYSYTDASFFPDYPKFSVWHNAYYAYTNDFNSAGTSFLGTSVWAFDRAAMLAGNPTAAMVRQRLSLANMIAMGSVGLEGMTTSSQNGLFVVPTSSTQLSIFEVTPNFGASTITVGPLTTLTVNPWNTSGAIAQQVGGTLGSLSPRMMFKVSYRNNGGTESIVTCHTIANGALGQVRWYELRRIAGNWTVFQQGDVPGTDGNSRWMPGISMDGCGNIALMYDVAGTGTPPAHPSIRYTGRNAGDPLNTMTLPEAVIINGATNFGGFRWGDYNTTVQDYSGPGVPANGSFWSTSQYANQLTRIANYSLTGGCAAAPIITAGTATLTAEGCVPNNGVIDPGETVTVNFCALNTGTSNTTNLVGTMQVSGGVTPISGPQNYGVLVFGGPAVCRSFSFSNTSGICGGTITVTIQWQDGATNLGTSSWTFTLGTTVVASSQNFDAVVAPALPAGWVASNPVGGGVLWVTSTAGTPAPPFVSAPNALFIDDPGIITDKQIVTPSFIPGGGARVSFANNYNLESGFDGGVLEISINGGAYQDIITAGGSFVAGGYTGVISSAFGSTIAGRNAWTGSSGGFITTTVNMPPASAGQPCTLKFRMGSDNSVAAVGWRVDDFTVSQPTCCGAVCTITCPANITVNSSPGACGANVSFAATTTGLCGAVTYSPASGSFFPVGTTTVTATAAAGPSCTFTVTVVDNVPPTITCPANITTNNTPGLCSAVVTYPLPTVTDNCGLPGPIALQQTASQTPTAGSVACNAGGFHTNNSYWRQYNLAPLALPGPVQLTNVQFGIELADANGTGTTQPVTIRLYTSSSPFPTGYPGSLTPLNGAGQIVNVPDQTLSVMNVTLASPITVAANARLVVELFTPDGRAPVNNRFFIGSNTSAQTGPSYIQAADCGIATPTDLASIGFPNMHIILNLSGNITGPSPLTQIAGLPSGSIFPVGVTTNTFRATDIAGNTSTCSFTVTVVDNQAPALACPASIVRPTDPNVCTATFTPPAPTFSDNCAVTSLTWVMTGATTGSSAASGINTVPSTAFGLTGTTGQGITTITYTAKDAAGNTTVCSFTVTVNDASIPVISGQPTNQFVCVGSDGAFTVTATAGAGNPLAYQWQTWTGPSGPWVNIAGATSATLLLPAVSFSQNTTDYRCILTGRCSVVTSGFGTLYVNPLPTISLLASRPLALLPGQSLTITTVVNPGGGTYQWFKNGVAMPGVTSATLSNLTVDDIGSYTCRYTDLNGCVRTSSAMVVTGESSCKLWVYENPNRGVFQVRFFNAVNEQVTVNIFNSGGGKVYSKAVTTGLAYSRIDVDISHEAAGTYIVEVINATGKRACNAKEKFVKLY